jgi:hypothetical protein
MRASVFRKIALWPTAVVLVSAAVPTGSSAQAPSGDLAYCRALSTLYIRYVGHNWQYGDHQMLQANNDAQVALAKCEQGDPAGAIPVLERELIKNGFTLPARG